MKIAFITRSTLYSVPGGDTEQIVQTARFLKEMGVGSETEYKLQRMADKAVMQHA